MTIAQITLLISALFLILWLAYKIGKLILRIALGLAILGLIGFFFWSLFHH